MAKEKPMESMSVTPSQLIQVILAAIDANEPLLIEGSQGIGKSSCAAQAAAIRSLSLGDIRLPLLDPVDLRGCPSIRDGRTHWNPPAFFPGETDDPTLLFFDEITAAAPAMQAAAYQIILDRQCGEYRLPKSTRIIAAGNRQKDKAVAFRMSSALRGRFISVTLETSIKDWISWAAKNQIDPVVMAYLRAVPQALNEDAEDATGITPTPRTWAKVSNMQPTKLDPNIRAQVIAGLVGQARALEFCGYLDLFPSMIHPDTCINKPHAAPIPDKPQVFWMLGQALLNHANAGNVDQIMTYLQRWPVEYQACYVPDLAEAQPALTMTSQYISWANDHGNIVAN